MSIYHQHAANFARQYESVSAEQVHQSWLHLLTQVPSKTALDVGAGSGRDARFLVKKDFHVITINLSNHITQISYYFGKLFPVPAKWKYKFYEKNC